MIGENMHFFYSRSFAASKGTLRFWGAPVACCTDQTPYVKQVIYDPQ